MGQVVERKEKGMTGPQTNKSGQIQARKPDAATSLIALVQKCEGEIARALPKHITADRMARVIITALRVNKDLQECTPGSFMGCIMSASQIGLEPNTPLAQCFLIPRNMKRGGSTVKECTMIIGYQGMMDISFRSDKVTSIWAHVVRQGDFFEYELGLKPTLRHKPTSNASGAITYVYAIARLKTGDEVFVVLSREEIEQRRARSASASSSYSPWKRDYEAMCMKTGVRALWKWLPKSAEMATAVAIDEASESGRPLEYDPEVTDALVKAGVGMDNTPRDDSYLFDKETATPVEPESDNIPTEPDATMTDDERGEIEARKDQTSILDNI
jgi:recombination protein RecT